MNDGGDEEAREDRETPCMFCGHGAPSHAIDDEERRECKRGRCECPQYEVDDRRRCPECVSVEINATETVCLACSNRAGSEQ